MIWAYVPCEHSKERNYRINNFREMFGEKFGEMFGEMFGEKFGEMFGEPIVPTFDFW